MSFKQERFLIEAVEQCDLFKIISHIKYGHNIHIQNNLGQNLLVHTLKQQNHQNRIFSRKRFQVFQFLITNCKLDPHVFDYCGKNVFNWAANLNCTQEALYLLHSYPGDIDILIRDQSGLCSLHYAIEYGNEILVHAIVNYLVHYRIRFDIKDNYNNTPEELARKLGYDYLAEYLAETCRATIFMSKEIPFQQQRPTTNKSKGTVATKNSMASSSSSSMTDSSEIFHVLETKIEAARYSNDWKTVASLRLNKKPSNEKKSNQIVIPTIQLNRLPASSILPKISSINNNNNNTLSSNNISVHLLHLIEPQICSSYRQPFIPYYQPTISSTLVHLPSSISHRKQSAASSARMPSVMKNRKRDSNASQFNGSVTQDGQGRQTLSSVSKHRKSSITQNQAVDNAGLTKIRSKHMVTVQN
ncbi:unnamed protein product [Adineta steineri]|uniref:Uncharacterized protein n=1 Tax=Adineta steineri TaxID=433720 RepID=A0A813QI02_9BILA|nr:unnamed protein product [Adineta steineri]CAF3663497.1 unnamed protein product [Adineta steineri]